MEQLREIDKKREILMHQVLESQKELQKLSAYLSQLESQLSLVFAASPDMIVIIDPSGLIINVSYMACKILGYLPKEIKGHYVWEYLHPEDVERTKKLTEQVVKEKMLILGEKMFTNRWKKRDGSYAKLAWRFSIYEPNSGDIIGYATNISNLNQMSPFSFQLVKKAADLARDGIVITDMTEKDNPIIYVNKAFCENCGYTMLELLGQNCRILQSDERNQKALQTIRESIAAGSSCEVLLKNFKKDKTVFYNHLIASAVEENGVVTNYIGISRNVTHLVEGGFYVWDINSPTGFGK